jgi:small GTP-binding protein
MANPASFCRGKVVFVGDTSVGKTSIINAYHHIRIDNLTPTIASQATATTGDYHGTTVNITIYDTAGQEDYRCLVPLYARGAQVAVIVYAEDLQSSFSHIPNWIEYLKQNASIPHMLLVGNKVDLHGELALNVTDSFAEASGLPLIRTSAKTGQNIDVLFGAIVKFVETDAPQETGPPSIGIENSTRPAGASRCC